MEKEEWKDIEGFEGMYQVSNLGRIKSLARFKRRNDLIVSGSPNTTGYMVVQLYKDKKRVSKLIHRLVLSAFEPIDNAEEMTVNHKDLNIKNNALVNLEWCTQLDNNKHYWRTTDLSERKPTPSGEAHHLAVLNEELVLEIRQKASEGRSVNSLAKEYGIAEGTARAVVKRTTWKHI